MIKSIILGLLLAASSLTAWAGNTNSTSLFNANELTIGIASQIGLHGQYDANFQAEVNYFVTKNWGLSARLPFYETTGKTFEQASLSVVGRLPVLKVFGPYARAGTLYNWRSDSWNGLGAAGLEFRINKSVGIFAEGNYQFSSFDRFENGRWGLLAGIRAVVF